MTVSTAAPLAALQDKSMLRGIYKCRVKVEGLNAYYGIDRNGDILGRGLRVVWPGDSDAEIVAELRREMRAKEPRHLKLVPTHPPIAVPQITLSEAIDLDGPAYARWLYG